MISIADSHVQYAIKFIDPLEPESYAVGNRIYRTREEAVAAADRIQKTWKQHCAALPRHSTMQIIECMV